MTISFEFEELLTTFCVNFFAFDGQETLEEKYVSIFLKVEFCQELEMGMAWPIA